MKTFLTFLLLTTAMGCGAGSKPQPPVAEAVPYKDFIADIKAQKLVLKDSAVSQVQKLLFKAVNDKVPYYWKGTPWDFNGMSREPKKGAIACGFFVTNVLDDLGFSIKRVYLAQQASSVMIKELTVNIKTLSSIETLKKYALQQKENDVFIVGLDFHTGFITREKDKVYFIHSNYINASGVTKEEVDNSTALAQSKIFMIGSLLQNEKLMEQWTE